MYSRHVARFGWFRRNAKVILQVRDNSNASWRDANARDLDELEEEKLVDCRRRFSNGFFPVGVRVKTNQRSGFHKGATGVVQFQEPHEGKVWVLRDGSDSPVYFYGYELDFEEGTFTTPRQAVVSIPGDDVERMWWIAIGDQSNQGEVMAEWCRENAIEDHAIIVSDYDSDRADVRLVGFRDEGDAILFYTRFR